ncbi:MAG: ABC transporter permease [Flavobacteriaceae bacterium]|nr:ABC transporter permease [Flavobacteriaceae bacterium]
MQSKPTSLTKLALKKFTKNKIGLFSFWYIILCGFMAVFAYVLAPDNSPNAKIQHIEIHTKKPFFKVKLLKEIREKKVNQNYLNKLFFGNKNYALETPINAFFIKKDTLTVRLYSEVNKNVKDEFSKQKTFFYIKEKYKINDKTFYLGTDKYGRDYLSRMLIGTRISFFIGFIAVFISLIIGISIGSVAGYFGGKVDTFVMWLINVTWSIPTLLMVIAITLSLGKGYWQVFIAVGLTMWVEVARVVRGQIMSAKQQQYVEAANALGYSSFRIITKHILPNIMAPVIVISAANFAAAILIESGLSFLGIGAQPPTPSWGAMIKDHYNYIILGKSYLAVIPGLAIMSLVMAFMLIGNALRDALDVKN